MTELKYQPKTFGDVIHQVRQDLEYMELRSLPTVLFAILLNAEFQLLASYRFARYFFLRRTLFGSFVLAITRYWQLTNFGSEISPVADIGKGPRLPHPNGIIIGEGAVVGDHVHIFQQVTLESHGHPGAKASYPSINNGVVIYAGAKVLGGITIGEQAVIGAGAVVLGDVPPRATVVGIPARVCKSQQNADAVLPRKKSAECQQQ